MALNRARLIDGTIQITAKHGTNLLYDLCGRRNHELTINANGALVDKTLFYLPNNLLERTENSAGEVSDYQYDGAIARRKVYTTNKTKQESSYTPNSWLESENYLDEAQNIKSTTAYALNLTGSPYEQKTKLRTTNGADGYDDKIKTTYASFDMDKISRVEGIRQYVDGGTSQSTVQTYYDPNGNTELVVGGNQEPRHFITNSKGRIVKKTVGSDKEELRFYTTNDQPLGRFGNIPPEGFKGEVTYSDFDLNLHPVSEHFPPPTPSACLVIMNDTFASISERMYGDQSFANLIAEENGFGLEEKPPLGMQLTIPSIVNTNLHNMTGQYPIYNPAAIIGSLYPNMPRPPRVVVKTHPHRKLWHILVEALPGTAIMAFAPEFAGAFSGVFGELLGEALGFALAGAASNFTQQELAIGFGDQERLSLKSLGQSALLSMGTTGVARVIGMDLMKSPVYRNFLDDAMKNIELTIATQGLSFATGQQRHFDWRTMLASITNTFANVGVKQMDLGAPRFSDAIATASASVASISIDKIYGIEMDAEAIAINTLGTFIGNQIAAQVKQSYNEYQIKKSFEAQLHISQVPEIRQTLAESEQHFLQSINLNPYERSQSSSHTQRSEHHQTIKAEHARDEEIINRTSHRNNAHSRTEVQKKQPSQAQHRFWGNRKQGEEVSIINETVEAYRSGRVFQSEEVTGYPYLEPSTLNPSLKLIMYSNKNVVRVNSRLGFFESIKHEAQGKYNIDYKAIPDKTGGAYRKELIKKQSYYYTTPGSPKVGDISKELKIQAIYPS
jgi:hypothetical protein